MAVGEKTVDTATPALVPTSATSAAQVSDAELHARNAAMPSQPAHPLRASLGVCFARGTGQEISGLFRRTRLATDRGDHKAWKRTAPPCAG